ncbi:hypothetical protein ESA94_03940 [Lacibacter luteus]|uniref:Uncharacterized protein n=1 Tax=Lacibacter luteus TaxID=2508719 RepID=A0A4Q1CMZ9_9BACT|nr:hypothetical protein [Lacibacter luteus]RXK62174.1 hypothetical protein ESA94_03940 [Lacibacter luteus]
MGLFSFLNFLKADKNQKVEFDPNEYVPSFWEDDYCQIEIVPAENRYFIKKQSQQIDELASKSRTDYGFGETFERGPMPVTTRSKEFRVNFFEKTLTDFKFQKARHIRYNKSEILNCESGKTKAFGFSNFTIFFDTDDEFVKNIWVDIGLIVSVPQLDLIQDTLYTLGEECELVLIDWNTLSLYDLAYKSQIQDYLMWHFK